MYEKARFNKYLSATNDFLKLVRKGLDDNLIKYMSDPSEYLIVPKRQVERAAAVEISNNETEAVVEETPATQSVEAALVDPIVAVSSTPSSQHQNLREIPDYHKQFFNFDAMILPVLGDGACLYRSVSAFIFGDETKYFDLRKDATIFLENCFTHFYSEKILFSSLLVFPLKSLKIFLLMSFKIMKIMRWKI